MKVKSFRNLLLSSHTKKKNASLQKNKMNSKQKTYPIHFAPLQGFTDAPYRNAHERFFGGVDFYYTPFVRLENNKTFRKRDLRDIDKGHNTASHLIPQLIAGTPDELNQIVTLFVEKGYTEADINLGCPFPMLAKRCKGAGILPYPDKVKDLLNVITDFPTIHFSVKLRLGWEDAQECLNLLSILNDLPLRQIALHARIGKQQYKGATDCRSFEKFYLSCKHPLIYNGDILTMEDIDEITTLFPDLAGVMIGRGLLSNPALALEYKTGRRISVDEMGDKVKLFHSHLFSYYQNHLEGNTQLLNKMKVYWEYLLPDMNKKIRKKILKSTTLGNYQAAVIEAFKDASL